MSLSYFSAVSVADGQTVTSLTNLNEILTALNGDPYFTSIDDIGRVVVYYTHIDGRQNKRIVHEPSNATVSWTPIARDGVWKKTRIRVFSLEEAEHVIERSDIGEDEDISHFANVMALNTL